MNWKIILSVLVIQISTIASSNAEQPLIGIITDINGTAWRKPHGSNTKAAINLGDDLHRGDTISTDENPDSRVEGTIGGTRAGLKRTETYNFILRADSQVTVEELLLLVGIDGDIEFKSKKGFSPKGQTHETSAAAIGTHFRIVSREAGTIVDVLDGKVELTRVGRADEPKEVIRDYKAATNRLLFRINPALEDELDAASTISENLQQEFEEHEISFSPKATISIEQKGRRWVIIDKENRQRYLVLKKQNQRAQNRLNVYDDSLMIISPRPLSLYRGVLLSITPGTGTIYARGNRRSAIARQILSTGALVGALVFNAKREDALNASIVTYSDYKAEILPAQTKQLYNQHRTDRQNARKYRRDAIILGTVFVASLAAETILVLRDYGKYKEVTKEFREMEKALSMSKIGLEMRNDGLVAQARWYFR